MSLRSDAHPRDYRGLFEQLCLGKVVFVAAGEEAVTGISQIFPKSLSNGWNFLIGGSGGEGDSNTIQRRGKG